MDISWRLVTLGRKKEKVERVESSRVFTWGCTARRRRGCSDVTWFSSSSRLGANTVLIGSFCRARLPLLFLFFLFDFLPFLLISCTLFCASTQEEKRKPGMPVLSRERRRRIELPNNRWADKRAGVRCVRRAISKSPRVRFNDANRNGNKDTHRYRHKAGWSVDAKFFSLSLCSVAISIYSLLTLYGDLFLSLSPLFLPESSSGDRT